MDVNKYSVQWTYLFRKYSFTKVLSICSCDLIRTANKSIVKFNSLRVCFVCFIMNIFVSCMFINKGGVICSWDWIWYLNKSIFNSMHYVCSFRVSPLIMIINFTATKLIVWLIKVYYNISLIKSNKYHTLSSTLRNVTSSKRHDLVIIMKANRSLSIFIKKKQLRRYISRFCMRTR